MWEYREYIEVKYATFAFSTWTPHHWLFPMSSPHITFVQEKPLAVLEATLPAVPPWWTQCAPSQPASSSPLPCHRWSLLGPWSPSGSWRAPRDRHSGELTKGTSNTWGSCSWIMACLWSAAPATSFPYGYEDVAQLLPSLLCYLFLPTPHLQLAIIIILPYSVYMHLHP